MESKNLLTLAITLTVGIILAGSLLMPVISDAIEDNQMTYLNNTGIKWHMVQADESVTASYDGTTFTVNDYTLTFGATYSCISADTFCVRWSNNAVAFVDLREGTGANLAKWSMECSNGQCEVTNLADTTDTYTLTYDWLFIPTANQDDDSDWVMTAGTSTYYVAESSPIYISSFDNAIVIEGTINDLDITSSGTSTTYTVTKEEIPGYEEKVYKLTSININVDGTDRTFNRLILPSEVVVTKEGTSPYIALYSAIPVMVILGLVVAALGAIYTKRND